MKNVDDDIKLLTELLLQEIWAGSNKIIATKWKQVKENLNTKSTVGTLQARFKKIVRAHRTNEWGARLL
jgi:hypothetical protein